MSLWTWSIAKWWSLCWHNVARKYVFSLCKALNERSVVALDNGTTRSRRSTAIAAANAVCKQRILCPWQWEWVENSHITVLFNNEYFTLNLHYTSENFDNVAKSGEARTCLTASNSGRHAPPCLNGSAAHVRRWNWTTCNVSEHCVARLLWRGLRLVITTWWQIG